MTSPPTAAQIEEIRERHAEYVNWLCQEGFDKWGPSDRITGFQEAHADRATLLAALDARQGVVDADELAGNMFLALGGDMPKERLTAAVKVAVMCGIIGPVPSEEELTRTLIENGVTIGAGSKAKAIRSLLLGESKEGRE